MDKTKLLQVKKNSFDLFNLQSNSKESPLTLAQVVGALAPALEVDVFTQEVNAPKVKTVAAGDWREMKGLSLIDRIAPGRVAFYPQWASNDLSIASTNLSPMIGTKGEMQGRCAVVEHRDSLFGLQAGIVTVGGLLGGPIHGLAGILVGKQAELLDRSVAIPLVEQEALSVWANKQADQLRTAKQLTWKRSAKLLALGAESRELLVISHGKEDWTEQRLTSELQDLDEIWLLEDRELQYESETDEVLEPEFKQHLELDPKVFVIKSGVSLNEFIHSTHWPTPSSNKHPKQPSDVLENVINSVWPDCDSKEARGATIGHVAGGPIYRDVKIVYRTKRIPETE